MFTISYTFNSSRRKENVKITHIRLSLIIFMCTYTYIIYIHTQHDLNCKLSSPNISVRNVRRRLHRKKWWTIC